MPGGVGEDCLSAKREFRSRPAWRATQGTPEGSGKRGVFFFGYFCLDKQEKVTALPGHNRHQKTREAHKKMEITPREISRRPRRHHMPMRHGAGKARTFRVTRGWRLANVL